MSTFKPFDLVTKEKGDYTGDGIVVTSWGKGSTERVVVGHAIHDGTGLLYHIYNPSQLSKFEGHPTNYHKNITHILSGVIGVSNG